MSIWNLTGDYLVGVRKKHGVTQQTIADEMGKHVQFVSNCERGVSPPTGGMIVAYEACCPSFKSEKALDLYAQAQRNILEKKYLKASKSSRYYAKAGK